MIINHNMNAMNAHRSMTSNVARTGKSMEKLSSGLRINRAGDDAAGLAISEKMRGQIRGLDQASRNAQDGISLIQTAEGALNETHSILQRMRELSVQAANDTNVTTDRDKIQSEMDQLAHEITRISDTTEFNTQNLLDGEFTSKEFQIGANGDQKISLSINGMNSKDLSIVQGSTTSYDSGKLNLSKSVTTAVGVKIATAAASTAAVTAATVSVSTAGLITVTLGKTATNGVTSMSSSDVAALINADTAAAALVNVTVGTAAGNITGAVASAAVTGATTKDSNAVSVATYEDANTAIETINSAINTVSEERSKLGSYQNRLEHTINNLSTSSENLQASESRIRDVDMASEMMNFSKENILQQAAQAMLAQAKQAPQGVLQLLR